MEVARGGAHVGFVRHFFVNTPGMYTLKKGLVDLHDENRSGILTRAMPLRTDHAPGPAVADKEDDFDRIEANGGPGMPLKTYLPKAEQDQGKKLLPSLTPSNASAAVAATAARSRVAGCLKVKEKRLDIETWTCQGKHHKGSHFPICVFTNNVSRRSPEAHERRQKKAQEKGASSQGPADRPGPSAGPTNPQLRTNLQHPSANSISPPLQTSQQNAIAGAMSQPSLPSQEMHPSAGATLWPTSQQPGAGTPTQQPGAGTTSQQPGAGATTWPNQPGHAPHEAYTWGGGYYASSASSHSAGHSSWWQQRRW